MPSLPTIPPPAPSFLLSPEVGLAGFVGVVVVVFSAWFLGGRVVQKLAERRRTRIADAENSDNIASVVLERRVKGYSITAADVLVAARTALETTKSTAATKTHLSSLHKALMSTTSAKSIFSTDAPVTVRLAPGSRVLLSQKGEQHAPGRFMVRTPRARLGPSPLRVVFAAPESADSLVSPRLGSKSPRSVAPVAVVDESPIASTQPPVALTLSALILSRLHESDSASDPDYEDDEIPEPLPPSSVTSTSSPVCTQARLFIGSQLGNLQRTPHVKRPAAKTSRQSTSPTGRWLSGRMEKIPSRGGKENGTPVRVPRRARCAH